MKHYYLFSYSWTKYDGSMGNQCVTLSVDVSVDAADATVAIARQMKYKAVVPFLFKTINEDSYHVFNEQFESKGIE